MARGATVKGAPPVKNGSERLLRQIGRRMESLVPGRGAIGCGRLLDVDLVRAGWRAKSLKESFIANQQMPRGEYPGLCEHDGIFHGSFVHEHVAVARVALHHMLLLAMN